MCKCERAETRLSVTLRVWGGEGYREGGVEGDRYQR